MAEDQNAGAIDGKAAAGDANAGGDVKSADAGAAADNKAAASATVVPEKYDLKLPEGSQLDKTAIDRISTYAKEKGLSQDAAQELLNRENGAVEAHVAAQSKRLEEKRDEWAKAWEADKEIGGAAFKENVELAKRVVERFGDTELRTALDQSGLGNHPALARLLVKIGKSMGDDKLVVGKTASGEKSLASMLYPDSK